MSDPQSIPRHLDKRATSLLNAPEAQGDDDDLLTTKQMSDWYQVSQQWLAIGRVKGYGPKFVVLAPKIVRYRRGEGRRYLHEREHQRTSEYVAGHDDEQR